MPHYDLRGQTLGPQQINTIGQNRRAINRTQSPGNHNNFLKNDKKKPPKVGGFI